MAEIKSGVTVSLKDLFSQGMNKAAGAASGFAGKTLGAIGKVDKAISGTAVKLAAFGLTLSIGVAAKGIIELDHRMTRLGLSVNASAERISKLKRTVFDVAQAADVKIDPSNILSGIEVVISKTSDLKYAEDNIRNIALAIQATGESGESMGDLFSEFKKFDYSAEQISSLMDDMVAQANQGAFSLADFAKATPQIFSSLEAKKLGAAPENIKSVNAALQIINAGAKNSTKTFAAFNSVFEEITDPSKQKDLRKLVNVNVKDSNGNLKDFNDIMFEIAEKAKDPRNANMLNKIFNSSSMVAINSYVSHGKKMKDTLTDLGDTTGLLQKQSAAMADTLQSNIKNLQTAFHSVADIGLTGPLAGLTGLLNKLSENPQRLKIVFGVIAGGIGAITAIKGIAGISRLVGSLLQLKGGKINIAESLNMATAMPVYVTNWGGGTGVPGIGAGGSFQLPNQGNAPGGGSLRTGLSDVAAFLPFAMFISDKIMKHVVAPAQEKLAVIDPAVPGVSNYYNLNPKARKKLWAEYNAKHGNTDNSETYQLPQSRTHEKRAGSASDLPPQITQTQAIEKPDWRESPSQKRYRQRYQRAMPVSDLPPQITQTGTSVTPQKVELGGQAVIGVDIKLSGNTPTASVTMRNNTTPFMFNTGSRNELRRGGI